MDHGIPMGAVHADIRTTGRKIADLLDVEAGLRDVLLPTRYDGFARDLASLVDPESGLATLLDDAAGGASRSPGIAPDRPAFPTTKTPVTPTRDTGPTDRVTEVVTAVLQVSRQVETLAGLGRGFVEDSLWQIHMSALLETGRGLRTLADRVAARSISSEQAATILTEAREILRGIPNYFGNSRHLKAQNFCEQAMGVDERVAELAPMIARLFENSDDTVDVVC